MPIIDDERNVVVLRVVYDGPPLSGKTTTLRMLCAGLGVDITTPREQDGRTLYFDWVDYVGGLFEGRQIRCQIVSVPGQAKLARRRRLLLEAADVVVMVADTRASELSGCLELLTELRPWCRSREPPVGIVVQANKRDAPDRVPEGELRARLAQIAPIAMVETVAKTGEGVREAFVFAVRLALDRIRAYSDACPIPWGRPEVDGPDDLLELMTRAEVEPPKAPEPEASELPAPLDPTRWQARLDQLLAPRRADDQRVGLAEDEVVFVPDPMIPGGFIWPPVDGRAFVHDACKDRLVPTVTERGDWWASQGGWRLHSAGDAVLEDAEAGRVALIEWARLHASNLRHLSEGRALLLASAGRGRYRLWQLVRVIPALCDQLVRAMIEADAVSLTEELSDVASLLLRARRSLHDTTLRLRCTLWTVGRDPQYQPVYVGLMPMAGNGARAEAEGSALLERELSPVLRSLAGRRRDYAEILEALERARERDPDDFGLDVLHRIASVG